MESLFFKKKIRESLQPIAHLPGTTLTVMDLFFNNPVRRKCIKSEYSEFMKIDEIVRRLSLPYHEINVRLSHNNKSIRYYHSSKSEVEKKNRIDVICGFSFTKKSVFIKNKYNKMSISGWVYVHTKNDLEKKIQYFYVNKRSVENKFIHHSVLQAAKEVYKNLNKISYILYLSICPRELDVNVHPEKKKIDICNVRTVHGFVYQSVLFFIKVQLHKISSKDKSSKWILKNKNSSGTNIFSKNQCLDNVSDFESSSSDLKLDTVKSIENSTKKISFYKDFWFKKYHTMFGNFLTLIDKNYLLLEKNEKLFLLSLPMAKRLIYKSKLNLGVKGRGIQLKHFNTPYCVIINQNQRTILCSCKEVLCHIGINYFLSLNNVQFYSVPSIFSTQNLNNIILIVLFYLTRANKVKLSTLVQIIFNNMNVNVLCWNHLQILALFSEFKKYCSDLLKNPLPELLQSVSINSALSYLRI
ncbi:hypothetical protein [Buchnera aphidicola]|uniref:hypothetical protein n=1 Tax=Buchnera aphidicola TaxID=9 RepID=UPI0009E4FC4D|nr:hypothetical protein [Buchnera aphidicola]